MRLASKGKGANAMAARAHQMREMNRALHHTIAVPGVSSENREYLPVALLEVNKIVGDSAFALYDAPICCLALLSLRMHWAWVNAVCGTSWKVVSATPTPWAGTPSRCPS